MVSTPTDNYTTNNRVCQGDLTLASKIRTLVMVRSDVMTELTELLSAELGRQRMSMRELGRQAGFSATQVSDVLSEKAPASAEFVISASYALGLDPVRMLQASGHLRARPPSSLDDQVLSDFRRLAPHQQACVADLLADLAGRRVVDHAPAATPSRSDQRVEERGEIPNILLDPAAPMLFGDQHNPELDQALEMQLEWLYERFPLEERATLFAQAAIAFAMRMKERQERKQTNQT